MRGERRGNDTRHGDRCDTSDESTGARERVISGYKVKGTQLRMHGWIDRNEESSSNTRASDKRRKCEHDRMMRATRACKTRADRVSITSR